MAASALDLARLAIVFDTTSAPTAIAAMQQVVAQSRNVGQAVDQNTVKQRENAKATQDAIVALNQLNQAHAAAASGYKRGTTEGGQYVRTLHDIKRALDEEAKAAAHVAGGHQQRAAAISRLMTASRAEYQRGAISVNAYIDRLKALQGQMDTLVGAQNTMAASGGQAADRMAMLSGAVGGLVGILGFQALSAVTQFASFIAGLPGDLAKAGDSFTQFNARLTFAFRGSSQAAAAARADIIAIARESGVPYSQVAQSYGDLAIAGRGPGLSRSQITGLTSAFSTLGAMTGSDNASTGRAMWQFQQALALGRLTSQDFRFMSTNMPAIDDALAAGLQNSDGSYGVDVNRIPSMISRGEISAQRMVDALARGVESLRESAGGLPETMERARGRIQTEWELLLHNIEERVKSSQFYQSGMNWYGGQLAMASDVYSSSPEEQLRGWQSHRDNTWMIDPVSRSIADRRIRELEAIVNDPSRADPERWSGIAEEARVRGVARRTAINRGAQAVDELDPIQSSRGELTDVIARLEGALANRNSIPVGDLATMRAQDRRLGVEQSAATARGIAGEADVTRITRDRQALQEQIRAGGALPAEDVERYSRALAGARAQLNNLMYAFDRARVAARDAQSDLTTYGPGAGFDMAQRARALVEMARGQNQTISMGSAMALALRERLTGADNELGSRRFDMERREQILRPSFGGDAATRRAAGLDYDDAVFRASFGSGNVNNAEVASRTAADRDLRMRAAALEDGQALADRQRADQERVESMRLQLTLGGQLGQQARIALAQAQRELELRREFPEITQIQIDAEKARVSEQVRISEELDLQRQQMSLLADAAETAGTSITRALREGIIEGARTGSLRASVFFDALGDSALRVADRIMAAFLSPFEKQATSFVEQFIGNILPDIGSGGGVKTGKSIPGFASGVQNFSGGWALVGEKGPELLNLPRGSNVYSNGESKAMMGAPPVINIIDQRSGDSAPVEIQERPGPDGTRQIDVLILDAQKRNVQSGKMDGPMRSRFGVGAALRRD